MLLYLHFVSRYEIFGLALGNQIAAEMYEKIGNAQKSAAWSKSKVAEAEGNPQATEAYSKSAQAFEEQAIALLRGDNVAAEMYEKIAKAQENAANSYHHAMQQQFKGNPQLAELHRNAAQNIELQIAALDGGDQATAEMYEKIGRAQSSAAHHYDSATTDPRTEGNPQLAEAYRKSAQNYEQQAAALTQQAAALARGDLAAAEEYRQVAEGKK